MLTADGDADEAEVFPISVFAACGARDPVVIRPGALRLPVIVGLAIVGDEERTGLPEPVTALDRPDATPVPKPDTPVEIGRPVPFVSVTADGVPRFGVVSAGDVERTTAPVPFAALPIAAATPVPRPDTPVEIGKPLPFVRVTAEGVPRFGDTSVGELDRTVEPVPVEEVAPVPPFEGVNGFCRVMLLNVGEGYVWASADSGNISAAIMAFFIV